MLMLVGMLWALPAPLLLLLPAAALVWAMRRAPWPGPGVRNLARQQRRRWVLALGLVAATVLALWLPQRWQFSRLCASLGPPQVLQTALTAAYTVLSAHEDLDGGTHVQRQRISRRDTGAMLASAASAHFQGGRARWLLGMWGAASCPNPVTAAGSRAFQQTDHLARDTLRPASSR